METGRADSLESLPSRHERHEETTSIQRPNSSRKTTSSRCPNRNRDRPRGRAGPLAAGRAAIARYAKLAPSSPGVYRMIDANGDVLYVGKAKNIRKADRRLCAPDRLRPAHRAHDRGDRRARVRLDRDRDRGAAARSQPDQAAAAALQRAAARRQVVSLYPDHRATTGRRRSSSTAARAPARATTSARSPRSGRSTAPSPRCSARSCCAPAPTRSSRAARGRACCIRSSAARRPARGEIDFAEYAELVREANAFLSGKSQAVKDAARGRDGEGLGRARFRARRDLPRPPRGALGGAVASGHQSARRRGGRRLRRASGRAASAASRCSSSAPARTGATAPISRRADRSLAAGRGAGRVPRAVLRRQAVPALHPPLARDRGARAAGRGA